MPSRRFPFRRLLADRGIVGNIYKGKVVRVLPGMQAAFVDIGLERASFIHASDLSRGGAPSSEQGNGAEALPDEVVEDRR